MAIPTVDVFIAVWVDRIESRRQDQLMLLGMWVSELEPEFYSYMPGIISGIGAAGHDKMIFTREQAYAKPC